MCLFKERIRQCLAPAFPYTHLRPRAIRAVVGADFGLAAKSRFPDRSGGLVANVSSFIEDGIAMLIFKRKNKIFLKYFHGERGGIKVLRCCRMTVRYARRRTENSAVREGTKGLADEWRRFDYTSFLRGITSRELR